MASGNVCVGCGVVYQFRLEALELSVQLHFASVLLARRGRNEERHKTHHPLLHGGAELDIQVVCLIV